MSTGILTPAPPGFPASADHDGHVLSCPSCGTSVADLADAYPDYARQRIAELEGQVRLLTEKASSAADKLADYEDELRRLKARQSSGAASDTAADETRPHTANPQGRGSRLSNLLSRRKSSSALHAPPPPLPTTTPPVPPNPPVLPPIKHIDEELRETREALDKERALRAEAESKVAKQDADVEELTATLFQTANEMVATERKAKAKLQERVDILEKRDQEKKMRLQRLEGAVQRIDRIHGLLAS
ncbi:ribosomal protein L32 [Phyllosticta citrichinensis]|uniref:Ribosomal protein L32 n=1 Tax=Phyllosticta citrichinensis TaxID=1130410 RepID=A0ABR1XQL6_9PEZI